MSFDKMPCCGLFCVALLAQRELEEVYEEAKVLLNRSNTWQGKTSYRERCQLFHHFGLRTQKRFPRRPQLAKWIVEEANKTVLYVVVTTRHIQIVQNARVWDQYTGLEGLPIYKHWGKWKIIQHYHRVTQAPILEGKNERTQVDSCGHQHPLSGVGAKAYKSAGE